MCRNVFDEIKLHSTGDRDIMRAVAVAAISASFELNAGAIVCLTKTGRSVELQCNMRATLFRARGSGLCDDISLTVNVTDQSGDERMIDRRCWSVRFVLDSRKRPLRANAR